MADSRCFESNLSGGDYYPFGMILKGRNNALSGENYRFGFDGNENDDEVRGDNNSIEFGGRSIYDPRLGKFISVDPNWRSLGSYSPYAFAIDNPVLFIDIDGKGPGLGLFTYFSPYLLTPIWTSPQKAASSYQRTINITNAVISYPQFLWNGFVCDGMGIDNAHIPITTINGSYDFNIPSEEMAWWNTVGEPFGKQTGYDILFAGATEVGGVLISETAIAIKYIFNTSQVQIAMYAAGDFLNITARNANLWGGNFIKLNWGKTTTIIGRFEKDVRFIHASGEFREGVNNGGINLLNKSKALYDKTIAEGGDKLFFDTYNAPWLDDAIERGDVIRVVSDPYDPKNLYKNGVDGERTMFGREIEYLENKGFEFIDGEAIQKSY